MNKRRWRDMTAQAVAMTLIVVIAAVMFLGESCQRKPVLPHASFVHLSPDGWLRTMPLTFTPEYDDSASRYAITLAVRHASNYRYRNISLVVDVIGSDSTVERHNVEMPLADEYGNWSGGGFGTLYQAVVPIVDNVLPQHSRSVVVWQAMEGIDTLCGLESIGLIARPVQNE